MASIRKTKTGYRVRWREGGRGSPEKSVDAGKTIAEARKFRDIIAGRVREGRIGGGVIANRILVREWADKWLAGRNTRPKTLERERYIVKNHVLPRFGDEMVHGVSAQEAQSFITDLGKRVSPWTARRVHDVARVMFRDAHRNGYCPENVFWNVRRPGEPHREKRPPSVEDFCRVLKAMPQRHRTFVLTDGLTALRYGEITGAQWKDADLEGSRLHIRRQVVSNTTVVAQPKSEAGLRTIELLPVVRNALLDLPQRSEWIFPGARGGVLNHRAFLRRVWCPTVRALGLGKFTIHDLRHFAVSLWFAWGRSPLWVTQQTGHESVAFTLKQYGHLLREGQRLDEAETLRKIEEAFRAGERAAPVRPEGETGEEQDRINTGRGGRI